MILQMFFFISFLKIQYIKKISKMLLRKIRYFYLGTQATFTEEIFYV